MEKAIVTAFLQMGLTPRPIQLEYAKAVSDNLEETGQVALLHAETGVGKSLGYLVPAALLLANKPTHRIVIATQSHSLMNQIFDKDAPAISAMLSEHADRHIKISKLIGRANYIDPLRIEAALAGRTLTAAQQVLVTQLQDWEKTIAEYIDEYGDLPLDLTAGQICMRPESKNPLFDLRREMAMEADIIITTHAMIAADMVLGGSILHQDRATHLIIDEADMLVALLKDLQVRRLNLVRVSHELAGQITPAQMAHLERQMDAIRAETAHAEIVWSERADELAEETIYSLAAITRDFEEQPEILRSLGQLRSNGQLGLGVSTVRAEPSIICIDNWASKRFARYVADLSAGCILTSGTLSITQDPIKGMQWLRTELGIEHQGNLGEQLMFSPVRFGSLSLTLAGPEFPPVFVSDDEQDVSLNPEWVQRCGAYLRSRSGNVVVLTNSHAESDKMVKALLALGETRTIYRQMQGEKLSVALNAFKANGGFLITPAGHVGLDIRTQSGLLGFNELVITRIGFAPPKTETIRALAEFRRIHSKSKQDMFPVLMRSAFVESLGEAIRKGRQSIGRGFRSENDQIRVSILDPRFPLFTELSSRHAALRNIIPYRFHPAYQQATVLADTARSTAISEMIF